MSGKSLILRSVLKHQRGKYSCSAINSIGETMSASIYLRVRFAPICETHLPFVIDNNKHLSYQNSTPSTIIGGVANEPLKAECRMRADPPTNATFRWAYAKSFDNLLPANNQQLEALESKDFSNSIIQNNNNPRNDFNFSGPPTLISVATFTPTSPEQLSTGSLLCWASTALGSAREPCVIKLQQASAPEQPKSCQLINATPRSLSFTCVAGASGGSKQALRLNIIDPQSNKLLASATAHPGTARDLESEWAEPLHSSASSHHIMSSKTQASNDDNVQTGSMRRRPQERDSQAANVHLPIEDTPTYSQSEQQVANSAKLIIDQSLEPSTSYLVSVIAINSRGSSKPLTFSAQTPQQLSGGGVDATPTKTGASSAARRNLIGK